MIQLVRLIQDEKFEDLVFRLPFLVQHPKEAEEFTANGELTEDEDEDQ